MFVTVFQSEIVSITGQAQQQHEAHQRQLQVEDRQHPEIQGDPVRFLNLFSK
jgi:hypothetical protein